MIDILDRQQALANQKVVQGRDRHDQALELQVRDIHGALLLSQWAEASGSPPLPGAKPLPPRRSTQGEGHTAARGDEGKPKTKGPHEAGLVGNAGYSAGVGFRLNIPARLSHSSIFAP